MVKYVFIHKDIHVDFAVYCDHEMNNLESIDASMQASELKLAIIEPSKGFLHFLLV